MCRITLLYLTVLLSTYCIAKDTKKDGDEAEKWKKKDVRDYSDADLERLFDQWEDNDDEKLPEDELPEWKKEPPKVDMSQLDPENPEAMLRMSKKGRTLMMFATVSGNPTEKETEQITQLWQTSLFNGQFETQRYVVSSNRVIFMIKDGSKAWEIKDFLVQQERCEEVTIEGKSYTGAASQGRNKKPENQDKKGSSDSSKKKSADSNEIKKSKVPEKETNKKAKDSREDNVANKKSLDEKHLKTKHNVDVHDKISKTKANFDGKKDEL